LTPNIFYSLSDDDDDTSDDVPLLLEGRPDQLNFQNTQIKGSSSMSKYTTMPPTEMSNCEAGVGGIHCHTATARAKELSQQSANATHRLRIAAVLCIFFIAGEIVGGYMSQSLAIMTDAAHMLGDFASFCISLGAIWLGSKGAKASYNYGYARAEALGALMTLTIMWGVAVVLVYLACNRIANPGSFEVEPDTMMIVAGCAVVFNIILGLLLHGVPGHGHSHGGHSHHSTSSDHRGHINVRAAAIHVLGDFIQAVGVLIASFIIKAVGPSAKMADPICTLLFSVIALITTITVLKDVIRILMEGKPKSVPYADIKESLAEIESVQSVHDLRIWTLTGDKTVLTVHLAVDASSTKETVLQSASKCINTKYGINITTIQVEDYEGQQMESCGDCNTIIE